MLRKSSVPKSFKISNSLRTLDLDSGFITDLSSRLWMNYFTECIIHKQLKLVGIFIYGDGKRVSLSENSSKKHYYLIFIYYEEPRVKNTLSNYIYGIVDIKNRKIVSFNSEEYNEILCKLPCLQILRDEDKLVLEKKIMVVLNSLDSCRECEIDYNIDGYKRELKNKSEYSLVLCDLWKNGYPNDMVRKWYKVYLENLSKEESPKMVDLIDWFKVRI